MRPGVLVASFCCALVGIPSPQLAATEPAVARAAMAAEDPVERQFVLGAAHVEGFDQTQWRTSLELCNLGVATRSVQIDFLARGRANLTPQGASMLLPWGRCARFDDVVGSLFGLDHAAGAIRVGCDGGGCQALARTFNDSGEGTFGSGQPALLAEDAVEAGESAALIHLSESVDDGIGYRTNLELLNATDDALTVRIDLYGASGAELGALTVDLLPLEVRQLTRVFRLVTTSAVADGYALLHTPTPGGVFFAAASLVDNRTGDGTTIAANVVSSGLPPLEPLTVANAGSARLLQTLRIPGFQASAGSQCSVDFSPDGRLLSGACKRTTIPVWEVASGQLLRSLLPSPAHVVAVAFSPDSGMLATGEFSGRIAFWDPSTGELNRQLQFSSTPVWELAFSPNGEWLGVASVNYYSSPDPASLAGMRLVDLRNGAALWAYPADGEAIPLAVGIDPSGTLVAFGTIADGLVVMDGASGQPIWSSPIAAPVADVAFSPDGLLLAAAADDTRIRLWWASNHELARTLEGHSHYVNGIAFSPDGSLLASGSHDRTVGIWDVQSGQRLAVLGGHDSAVLRVAVDPSGTLIASISWDGTVRIWGVPTGS